MKSTLLRILTADETGLVKTSELAPNGCKITKKFGVQSRSRMIDQLTWAGTADAPESEVCSFILLAFRLFSTVLFLSCDARRIPVPFQFAYSCQNGMVEVCRTADGAVNYSVVATAPPAKASDHALVGLAVYGQTRSACFFSCFPLANRFCCVLQENAHMHCRRCGPAVGFPRAARTADCRGKAVVGSWRGSEANALVIESAVDRCRRKRASPRVVGY